MKRFKISLIFCLLCTISGLRNVLGGGAADRDLSLSKSQKHALDKFKQSMEPFLDQEYKKSEVYLIKWLRSANFNPDIAAEKLLSDIQWRQENNMETIQDEDWSDFREKFEYDFEGIDKDGQPVLIADIGNWDFRQALVSGDAPKMERYIYKIFDEISIKVRDLQKANTTVTRGDYIIDLAGFNAVQQGCIPCISLYLTLATALDPHFPELVDHLIFLNTPSVFELVLNAVKPAMPAELQKSLVVFGSNKKEWQKYLRKLIRDDQLIVPLGGTKLKD